MSGITDELREYAGSFYLFRYKDVREKLDAIADRIDAKHRKAEDEWRAKNGDMWLKGYAECHEELMEGHPVIVAGLENAGWVKLPVDADGVQIRVGDVLDECAVNTYAFLPAKVVGYHECCGEIMPIVENDGEFQVKPDCVCHYHETTVEDVLREFAQEMSENMGMYTGEAIDADEWRDADARTVEKYAERLELREVGA